MISNLSAVLFYRTKSDISLLFSPCLFVVIGIQFFFNFKFIERCSSAGFCPQSYHARLKKLYIDPLGVPL